MRKSILFFDNMRKALLALVLSATAVSALACGPYARSYLAEEYYMFRACGDNMDGRISDGVEDERTANCRAWAALTSADIPLEDIQQVVYKWNLQQIEELQNATKDGMKDYAADNIFATWIVRHQDLEVAAFLLLAKQNETVRLASIDPWYYAVEGDEVSMELNRIAQTADTYTGTRLRDRYTLQAIRALFSLKRYEDCLNVWMEHRSDFSDNIIRTLTVDYVAGVYRRLGKKNLARELYLSVEDYSGAYSCSDTDKSYYEWLFEISPEDESMALYLQRRIHIFENKCHTDWPEGWFEDDLKECRELYAFITKCIRQKPAEPALWYYAGAFLADKLEKKDEALRYIRQARKARCTSEDLASSIRVLDMYFAAKYADRYSWALENRMFRDLRWLDGKIVDGLDDATKEKIEKKGFSNHICGFSQYYWNDMMRKVVIGQLVPLCIQSGYKTRALQYLNMADNRLFQLVPDHTLTWRGKLVDHDWVWLPDTTMTMTDYRAAVAQHNEYDYSNDFFVNLDSLGVRYVQRLAKRMEHPLGAFDRFLTERSYGDRQYLDDIIGTQLIAARRYEEAIPYLERVSREFNMSRNVYPHCNIDPFTEERKGADAYYKLHFAKEMASLKKTIARTKNPDDRAEAMLRYARGMQNAVGDQCWPLTSYYWGDFVCYPFYGQNQQTFITAATAKAEQMKREAFKLFTDDERAAKACADWLMFKTAVSRYPNTETAHNVQGSCDCLVDYHLRPVTPPRLRDDEIGF